MCIVRIGWLFNMSLKLSYILPCYNVERFVSECLDSIYTQDMPEEDFEVICVNDCSTDGTRAIIADFSEKHSNLTLIDHEKNLTAGGARNTGIEVAKGKYIWFVDPDDKIVSYCAEGVYEIAKEKEVDILMFNYEAVDEANNLIKKDAFFPDSVVLGGQDFIVKYFPNRFSMLCIVWRCLFRTTFLQERGLWFPIMRKAQDVSFLWKAMLSAKRVASINDIYYTYRRNPYSVTNKRFEAGVLFSERILFANEIKKILDDQGLKIDMLIRKEMVKTLKWCVNSNLELLRQMTVDERKRFYDEIVNNKHAVDRVKPYMNRKQKKLFSVIGGVRFWLLKVRMLGAI